jgi:hypothetical protein
VTCAPIALFVYNRPWHTRQTVESLLANAEAKDSDLYVFSDAAKNEQAGKAVSEVRTYVHGIEGFRSVTVIEREENFGLARSIIEGVGQICEQRGRVIVMEDDLRVSPHFLRYMNAGLERYEHEKQVMQIAGYMFPVELDIEDDALFLPFTSSWGWGTWERAWRNFDAPGSGYQVLEQDKELRTRFDLDGAYGYFKMLKQQLRGEVESWAIRWYLGTFLKSGLILYPRKSLVSNTGFDGSGVNCAVRNMPEERLDPDFEVVSMPDEIAVSPRYKFIAGTLPRPRLGIRALLNRMQNLIKSR